MAYMEKKLSRISNISQKRLGLAQRIVLASYLSDFIHKIEM